MTTMVEKYAYENVRQMKGIKNLYGTYYYGHIDDYIKLVEECANKGFVYAASQMVDEILEEESFRPCGDLRACFDWKASRGGYYFWERIHHGVDTITEYVLTKK